VQNGRIASEKKQSEFKRRKLEKSARKLEKKALA
jgi:hypothetical protein